MGGGSEALDSALRSLGFWQGYQIPLWEMVALQHIRS